MTSRLDTTRSRNPHSRIAALDSERLRGEIDASEQVGDIYATDVFVNPREDEPPVLHASQGVGDAGVKAEFKSNLHQSNSIPPRVDPPSGLRLTARLGASIDTYQLEAFDIGQYAGR